VSYPAINAPELMRLHIPLPPQPEQTYIADLLDYETAKIDALIIEQQRLIELLKEKRQAITSHTVTKGLNPNTPTKESGIEWLGRVPENWTSHRLGWLFRQQKRQGFPDREVLSVYRDYGVIRKDSRTDNFNKTPEDLSVYQLVDPGDLVVNKMTAWQGSLGVSRFEGITSPDYIVFVPCHAQVPEYLHLLLRSQSVVSTYLSISNGIRTAQWRLEPDAFLSLRVLLPPPYEQKAIAEFLGKTTAATYGLIGEAQAAISLLQERRTALISAAVTGKIDVRGLAASQPKKEAAA
jgi:type I restriction enzyme, S subunit